MTLNLSGLRSFEETDRPACNYTAAIAAMAYFNRVTTNPLGQVEHLHASQSDFEETGKRREGELASSRELQQALENELEAVQAKRKAIEAESQQRVLETGALKV